MADKPVTPEEAQRHIQDRVQALFDLVAAGKVHQVLWIVESPDSRIISGGVTCDECVGAMINALVSQACVLGKEVGMNVEVHHVRIVDPEGSPVH